MSQRSDIVLRSTDVDIAGDTVEINPVNGSKSFAFDPRGGTFTARSSAGNDRIVVNGENASVSLRPDDESSRSTVHLGGNLGFGSFGGGGADGSVRVLDGDRNTAVHLDGTRASVEVFAPGSDTNTAELDGRNAAVVVGGGSGDVPTPGTVEVKHGRNELAVAIDGERPRQYFYRGDTPTVAIDGSRAAIDLGSDDVAGEIDLVSTPTGSGGRSRIRIDAQGAGLHMEKESGSGSADRTVDLTDEGELTLGGTGGGVVSGELRMTGNDGQPRVQLLGGGSGRDASSISESVRIYASGRTGELSIGGNGQAGRFELLDADGDRTVGLAFGSLSLGTGTPDDPGYPGEVSVSNSDGIPVGVLRGSDGSLVLGGALQSGGKGDSATVQGEAGTVVLEDEEGNQTGVVEAGKGALSFRDAAGTEVMRIENGVVKTAQPVERL